MIGTLLSIIGVIITICFGIYSIWFNKKNKRKVSLEFKKKECYSLFKDDVSRLNIEMSYNKKPVSSSLMLLKAKLVNNGQGDIDKSRIYKPLKLIADKNFKWLEAKITNKPDGAISELEILNENELKVEWDLLKAEESIEFEALIEIKNVENSVVDNASVFYDTLTFDYRITDLNSIQEEKPKSDNFFNMIVYPFLIIIILMGFMISDIFPTIHFLPRQYELEYVIANHDSTENATILPIRENRVEVLKLKSKESIIMPINDFNRKYKVLKIDDVNVSTFDAKFNRFTGIFFIFSGCWLLMLRTYRNIKRKQKFKK